jgi:hypothetical protein
MRYMRYMRYMSYIDADMQRRNTGIGKENIF